MQIVSVLKSNATGTQECGVRAGGSGAAEGARAGEGWGMRRGAARAARAGACRSSVEAPWSLARHLDPAGRRVR